MSTFSLQDYKQLSNVIKALHFDHVLVQIPRREPRVLLTAFVKK